MIGKYNIKIRDKKFSYDLTLKRKYTQVKGSSASGKSLLYNLVLESARNKFIVVSSKLPLRALSKSRDNYELELSNFSGSIFVIDEDTQGMGSKEFADLLKSSDNYFILETRKSLAWLSISIEEIYELKTYAVGKYITRSFSNVYVDTKKFLSPDIFVTEGVGSDYTFFNNTLRCDVKGLGGKSNFVDFLSSLDSKYSRICVLVDGAAFGSHIEEAITYIRYDDRDIILLAPESFEYLLLKAGAVYVDTDVLDSTWNYCSIDYIKQFKTNGYTFRRDASVESWEQFYELLLAVLTSDSSHAYSKHEGKLSSYYFQFSNKVKSLLLDIADDVWVV